jgi:multicomponent Na+:H+ antiporter subunit D
MAAFTVGALSMVGLPPTAGFISKWYILLGTLEAQQVIAVAVIVTSTLLNAAYFLPIVYAAFFHAPKHTMGQGVSVVHEETPLTVLLAIAVTAAGTMALFFYPGTALELALQTPGPGP